MKKMKIAVVALGVLGAVHSVRAEDKPWTVFYLDANCFQVKYENSEWTDELIQKSVDSYIHGAVTHMFVNPNGMRAWYPSKVMEHGWDVLNEQGVKMSPRTKHIHQKMKAMVESGRDFYDIELKCIQKRGVQGWITMRMNDIHGCNEPSNPGLSIMFLRHPEYHRIPHARTNAYPPHALDYAHDAVKDLYTAACREMVELYDADGFDADWTRFPWLLTPGRERELSHRLTEVMRDIRAKAREMEKKRGRKITISATVMSDPEEALACGTDPEQWVKEGLIDVLFVANFFSCVNFNVSYAEWCKRIHAINPAIKIVPRVDTSVSRDRQCAMSFENYCGWFERLLVQGCNSFAFFNFFEYEPGHNGKGRLRKMVLEEGITLDHVRRFDRSYPVTHLDSGMLASDPFPFGKDKSPKEVAISIGSASGIKEVAVDAGFDAVPPAGTTLTLNGVAATATDGAYKPWWFKDKFIKGVVRCSFPASALKDGTNVVAFVGNGKARPNYCELHVIAKANGCNGRDACPHASAIPRQRNVSLGKRLRTDGDIGPYQPDQLATLHAFLVTASSNQCI